MAAEMNIQIDRTADVDLHLDEIPKLEMKLFCLSIAKMCEEYLKDPKHRAECEEWKRTHCKEEHHVYR